MGAGPHAEFEFEGLSDCSTTLGDIVVDGTLEDVEGAVTVGSCGGECRFSIEDKLTAVNIEPGGNFTFKAIFHRFKIVKTRCDTTHTSIRFRSVVDKFSAVDQLL